MDMERGMKEFPVKHPELQKLLAENTPRHRCGSCATFPGHLIFMRPMPMSGVTIVDGRWNGWFGWWCPECGALEERHEPADEHPFFLQQIAKGGTDVH